MEVRKLGLLLHRPTFAQPTWISIVVSDSQLSVDLRKMEEGDMEADDTDSRAPRSRSRKDTLKRANSVSTASITPTKSRALEGIQKLREKIKRLHKFVKWLQMVDIVFTNTSLTIFDIGNIQIGSMTTMLDTRQKTTDRNRMFDHCTDLKENQKPVEWMFTARSMLFFHDKRKDPVEIMDHCMFNVYGVLEGGTEGIRDAAVSVKFGKVNVPCDQILGCWTKLRTIKRLNVRKPKTKDLGVGLSTLVEELVSPPPRGRAETLIETTIESKEFMQSLLKGVKELQFAIGYLLISTTVTQIQPSGKPLQVVVGMKELGMDMHRLDQKSPAHRMYVYLY